MAPLGLRAQPQDGAKPLLGSGHHRVSLLGSCKPRGWVGLGAECGLTRVCYLKLAPERRLTHGLKYRPGWGRVSVTSGVFREGAVPFGHRWESRGAQQQPPQPSCPSVCCCDTKLHLLASKYGGKVTVLANSSCLRLLHRKAKRQIQ